MLEQEALNKLKKHLPYGASAKIAARLAIKKSAVSRALNGKLKTPIACTILEELSKEAKLYKETLISKTNSITETIESL